MAPCRTGGATEHRSHPSRTRAVAAVVVACLALAGTAVAGFPGPEPPPGQLGESPRLNTPNDANFDPCEPDSEHAPEPRPCTSYFSEQFGVFGFRPDSARDLLGRPTTYADCSQLDELGRAANRAKGDPECAQISGVRADSAWKYHAGSPEVAIAILDSGIEWQTRELIDKVRLNRRELPEPSRAGAALRGGVDCAAYTAPGYDADGNGAFNVADYACDPRVQIAGGVTEAEELLDASDLIAAFSDRSDDDGNGYTDDIAGWDFFDDDNDPFDASSCCSADGHGSGRMLEAARETDDARGEAGLCPRCQVVPLRVSDTFIVDTNLFAMGIVYAADNGVSVAAGAVGGLLNSSFARRAFRYADDKGMALTMVSSDINTANHNYPTNYNEAIYIAGTLPDTAPGERCEVPSLPAVGRPGDLREPPGCKEFLEAFEQATGIQAVSGQPPTTSFFRNSNLTQYGGKHDVSLVGSTGSVNTGQAAGAAGLLQSYARARLAGQDRLPPTLSGNEIRQLLTMTAEDVLPQNTGTIGLGDRANKGWDSHFGYGRVNLAAAMARVQSGRIPPEVQINAPDWFAPINVDRVPAGGIPVTARVAARHVTGAVGWELDVACGQDAVDERDFSRVAQGDGPIDGEIARLPRALLDRLAGECDGSVADDPGRPAGRPGDLWPADPYPDPDPERHAFQIRLTARMAADPANFGVYRKTLFAYEDDGNLRGWPRPMGSGSVRSHLVTGSGGESSPRLVDLDGDNRLDVLLPTSSGELYALRYDGTPLPTWNKGKPVRTRRYAVAVRHAGAGGLGEGLLAAAPREPLRVPAVGDVTGDGDPEVVVTAGERVYAWTHRGRRVAGFPRRIVPGLSAPCKPGIPKPCRKLDDRFITKDRHVKRGFLASPALADLDGNGRLDIVAASLDQHVYAWNGTGRLLDGFPARLDSGDPEDGAEIVNSPVIAELDGDDTPEIVVATNEVLDAKQESPDELQPEDFLSLFVSAAAGSNPVYAINADGSAVPGWPIEIGVLVGDILPLVVPGQDAAAADTDGDGRDEVVVSATSGQARLVAGDGKTVKALQAVPGPDAQVTDRGLEFSVAEYPSIGRLDGTGPLAAFQGGLSVNGAINLFAVNQNLPFNHTVQGWSLAGGSQGSYLPRFPVATDDFQLLAQPSIAKVDAEGTGRQALVGTGLYQLHAYGTEGREPADWPKFLGGWVQSTPAIGDADGDGRLEVMAFTREGWAFLWRTQAPTCRAGSTTTNAEWWTFHHDEHGTGNHGTDARPPSRPGRLTVTRSGADLRVSFARSGDDGRCGSPARYEVAGADRSIPDGEAFVAAERLEPSAGAREAQNGERVTIRVPGGARFGRLAVRAVDDAGNRSFVRSGARPRKAANPSPRPSRPLPADSDDEPPALGATESSDGGSLPFTGLALLGLVLLGLLLAGGGMMIRRGARGGPRRT